MSLLLDALKKAAEKKAKKNTGQSGSVDDTEIGTTELETQASDDTEMDHTVRGTRFDETEMDVTEMDTQAVDATSIDDTEMDHTELETELDVTDTLSDQQRAQFDATEIDSTELDTQAVEATSVEDTVMDRTELETQIDMTDIDRTELDDQVVVAPSVDDTVMDQTDLQTQVDATDIDQTEQHGRFDVIDEDVTELEPVAEETSEIEYIKQPIKPDDTEIGITQSPLFEEATEVDSTAEEEGPTLTGKDRTLLIVDEDEEDYGELSATQADQDKTQTELTDTATLPEEPEEEDLVLTDDDVTAFMGDGLREDTDISGPSDSATISPDDTTLTNPESLELTNFGYDEDLALGRDEDGTDTYSSPKGKGDWEREDSTEGVDLSDVPEPERTTEIREQTVPPASAVDIDKLTSDQTVTVKSTTATRTFAPDNYDRTLLRLHDTDASKIFPGMKSEGDTVMTPAYAKKVFLNKSQGLKIQTYKIFGGLGALILLLVMSWGLFQLQDESDKIDQGLVDLKRDPMPGIIKSSSGDETQDLFASEKSNVEDKFIELIATANEPEAGVEQDAAGSGKSVQDSAVESTVKVAGAGMASSESVDEVSAPVEPPQDSRGGEITKAPETDKIVTPVKASAKPQQAKTKLQISTVSQVSEKDQLLASAYESYESGDMDTARRLYDQVISLDPENRDALLGRAAIHVQDIEYEQAIELYQDLLVINPKDSMAMTSLISVANVDPQAGESQLKGLLREQPDLPYLHFALGNMYGVQQRWTEAQSAYFTALKHKPEDPNYAYNLAISLEHMNKPQLAIAYYQRALDNQHKGLATFNSEVVAQRIEVLSQ